MSTDLIEKAFNIAERKGFTISRHPNGTGIIRNYREYILMFPQKDGSVAYEVREPLYGPSVRGSTNSELELHALVKELR